MYLQPSIRVLNLEVEKSINVKSSDMLVISIQVAYVALFCFNSQIKNFGLTLLSYRLQYIKKSRYLVIWRCICFAAELNLAKLSQGSMRIITETACKWWRKLDSGMYTWSWSWWTCGCKTLQTHRSNLSKSVLFFPAHTAYMELHQCLVCYTTMSIFQAITHGIFSCTRHWSGISVQGDLSTVSSSVFELYVFNPVTTSRFSEYL